MASLNRAELIGNLGRDPEVRSTNDGTRVANLSVATTENWKDKSSGERKEATEWHRVTLWGQLAEIAEKYLKKGSKVYLSGKIETRKWTDKDGVEKYSTEIVLRGFDSKMIMLDGKSSDAPQQTAHGQAKQNGYQPRGREIDGDEIPF